MSDATDLRTYVTDSVDATTLVELTFHRDPDGAQSAAGVPSAAKLLTAATTALGLWKRYSGETFDATDYAHLDVGKDLTLHVLCKNCAAFIEADQFLESAKRGIADMVKANDRVDARTSSPVVPEQPAAGEPAPTFDFEPSDFDGFRIE